MVLVNQKRGRGRGAGEDISQCTYTELVPVECTAR